MIFREFTFSELRGLVAQPGLEHRPFKPGVGGSNPLGAISFNIKMTSARNFLGIVSASKEGVFREDQQNFLYRLEGSLEIFTDMHCGESERYPRKYDKMVESVNGINTWTKFVHWGHGKIYYISSLTDGDHSCCFLLESPSIKVSNDKSNFLASFCRALSYDVKRNGLILPFDFNRIVHKELNGRNHRIMY